MSPIYWHTAFNPSTVIGGIFYASLFLTIAWFLNRLIRKGIRAMLLRDLEERIDRTAVHFVTKLVHITVYVLAFLFFAHLVPAIRHFATALLAGFGVVSVVLALATQNTLANVIAGMAILLYRPFKVGDTVQFLTLNSIETGTLETLALGYTIVRTFDNRRIADLSSNGVMLSLRAWCDGAANAAKVRTDLYEQVKIRYDKESIGIANAATNVVVAMQPTS